MGLCCDMVVSLGSTSRVIGLPVKDFSFSLVFFVCICVHIKKINLVRRNKAMHTNMLISNSVRKKKL